jgi:hypothetical protein
MGERIITEIFAVATAIVGVAVIAVLVAQKAQTASVIGAAGTALAKDLSAAVSPVTGSTQIY